MTMRPERLRSTTGPTKVTGPTYGTTIDNPPRGSGLARADGWQRIRTEGKG